MSLAWLADKPERSQYPDCVAECVERMTRGAPLPDCCRVQPAVFERSCRIPRATSSTCVSRAMCPISRFALDANANATGGTAAAYQPAMLFLAGGRTDLGFGIAGFSTQKFEPVVAASPGRAQAIRNIIHLPSSLSCVLSATGPPNPVIRKLIVHKKHSTPVLRSLSSIK